MTTLSPLAQELNDDPLGRGYAGMADSRAQAADLNTEYRPTAIPVEEIKRYLRLYDLMPDVELDARSHSDEIRSRACMALLGALGDFDELRLHDPDIGASVTARFGAAIDDMQSTTNARAIAASSTEPYWNYLGADETEHANHKAALFALDMLNPQTRSQELGLGQVRWRDVDAAWAEIAEAGL